MRTKSNLRARATPHERVSHTVRFVEPEVELELIPAAEPAVAEATRSALAAAGLDRADDDRGSWWRAGVDETLDARSATPARGPSYVAAPSPRRTRGATRA